MYDGDYFASQRAWKSRRELLREVNLLMYSVQAVQRREALQSCAIGAFSHKLRQPFSIDMLVNNTLARLPDHSMTARSTDESSESWLRLLNGLLSE